MPVTKDEQQYNKTHFSLSDVNKEQILFYPDIVNSTAFGKFPGFARSSF